jgi:diguanylate cyclase (GGDEF)-like protein
VAKVLVVDDQQEIVRLLAAEMGRQGYDVSVARDGCQALAMAAADRPDVILLDIVMPGMDGIEVCRRLKADDELRMVPIILLTANDREADMVEGLDAGADDYVVKPFSSHVLAARVRAALRIKRLEDLLVEQAHIDPLTGLRNRRALMERLEQEWAHVQRHGRRLALVMVDIDHFKGVNDCYGHFVGDRLLQEISRTIAGQCRKSDLPARYGGEEFAIIVPDETASGAVYLAERCRRKIETIRLPLVAETLAATASFGVADASGLPSLEALLGRADAALYAAKRAGRNMVVRSNPPVAAQAVT